MTKVEALNILGLGRKYTLEEVKSSYRKLARKYHPDLAGVKYTQKFAEINDAYALITELGEEQGCILTHKNIFDVERA